MAISFGDSLKASKKTNQIEKVVAVDVPQVAAYATRSVSADPVAIAENTENWIPVSDKGYDFYDDYNDDDYSVVDVNKNITLNSSQINITQETNSQYIPFIMPRYYDGFDLSSTKLQFFYVNRLNSYGIDYPVNVYYNDDQLKFAWLVDDSATAVDGKLKFELQAVGVNSRGESYTWKSKANESMTVLKSLTGTKMIEPSETWKEDFLTVLNGRVAVATDAAAEAKSAIVTIEALATRAESAAADARAVADSLMDGIHDDVQATVESVIDSAVDGKISSALLNYYDRDAVDELLNNIDISDQLKEVKDQIKNLDGLSNFNVEYDGSKMRFFNGESVMNEIEINSDPTEEWTNSYTKSVEEKIELAASNLQDEILNLDSNVSNNYYKKTETYNQDEIDVKLSNVTVDLTGYATESFVKEKIDPISNSASKNAGDISILNQTVGDLQEIINSVDTSARLTYDIIYNDPEDENSGENVLVLYEIENEGAENEVRSPKKKYTITGGSGGSSSANTLYINFDVDDSGNKITFYVYTMEDAADNKAEIRYSFSGVDPAGDSISYANAVWKFRKGTSGPWTTIAEETVYPGEDLVFNTSKHITSANTYQFKLDLSDDSGAFATKTWSVQLTDLRLEVSLNDKIVNPIGPVSFDYTPYGAIPKEVHFILDGDEIGVVTTSVSGIPMPYTLASQEHGSHLLEVYMTANINGTTAESNHVFKDVLWTDPNEVAPVIGCTQQKFTARQYDTTTIVFTVHDPSTEFPTVVLAEDGLVVSTKVLEKATDEWQYRSDVVGDHTLTITCGETIKTLLVTVEKLDIKLEPVVAGLVFDFNPIGKSNSDTDRLWSGGDISMSVSPNFDWVNGGYQLDVNGDQYFCIKAGTRAVIDYQLFADDSKRNGKEFKLVFKSTNVQKADATFLHCMDNTTDSNHIGIQMNVHEAFIHGEVDSLQLPYSENDIIEFEFNISKDIEAVPMVMGYEDGVSTRPMVYDGAFNFTQNTPKYISLGSDYCDLHIYRFKVYNTSLNARGILNNFIADARNADEMIARYNRNQIYDENQNLDPDILAEKCPWLRVYKLSAPYFTNKKSDKVPGTTIQQIYNNGDRVLDNWTCYNAQHSGQGTSSDEYGAAGRNIDFIMNKSGVDGIYPYFVLGDGTEATEITMTRTSVPVAYLNFKANIASSNNMTNAMLANRYNEFEPYKRPFVRDEGVDTSYIKDTMQFANAVVFIQETNEDISTHREFADTSWHFYAIGNIGDSKKTDKTRLNDPTDKYECCVEIMDVELPLSDWPVDTMYNAMGYNIDKTTGEKIYIWAKDENLGILYEKIDGEYVLTQDTTVDLDKTYYVDILIHDDFSEDFTYGWRYIYKGDDDDENAEVADYCHRRWNELYRFVTTSSDEDFKVHFSDYFVTDSALYNYLFTTRYCLADNRAKNTFWHYAKTGEVDSDGNPIRKWDLTWGYDMDF